MTRVLVVDHAHSPVCGIHDLGVRMAARLSEGPLDVAHADCGSEDDYRRDLAGFDPDVVVVNYRADLMPWLMPAHSGCPTLAVLHNYELSTWRPLADGLLARGFDHVLVLEPGVGDDDRVHGVNRPLPDTPIGMSRYRNEPPVIGSFGFAFPHKGFDQVAAEVAHQLDEAIVWLHTPEAYFNGVNGAPLYAPEVIAEARRVVAAKPGVRVEQSVAHVPEGEVVRMLAGCDVCCLLYQPGQPDAGLSSAFDYLIAARRPTLVSNASMFRHGHPWVAVWPQVRLRDVLDDYDHWKTNAEVLYQSVAGRFATDFAAICGRVL
jgi:hypothetical protein